MKDFIKIFFGISALVAAFVLGRGYGEKTFKESEEYRNFIKANEDLNFSKNELENLKAKFQNIADGAENKKTDELLGQILTVFLNDLGITLQNKDAILKQSKIPACPAPVVVAPPVQPKPEPKVVQADQAIEKIKKEEKKISEQFAKIKANEWILMNSRNPQEALKNLEKVVVNKIKQGEFDNLIELVHCEQFVGEFKGPLKSSVGSQELGSFLFKLNRKKMPEGNSYKGSLQWSDLAGSINTKGGISNGCGHKMSNLEGRFFYLDDNKYIQAYKLNNGQVAGNMYESLPNRTSNWIGKFILSKNDQ